MAEPTILARLLDPLVATCQELGGAGLAIELGERAAELDDPDPDARVPLVRYYELLEFAHERCGEPLLGARMSLAMDPAALGILGFLAVTSPDLGTTFDRFIRYQNLLVEGERSTLERAGDEVVFRVENWGPPRLAHQVWNEAAIVDMIVNGRRLAGASFEVREVRLRHLAHAGAGALAELLDAPVRFGAEDNAMVVDAAALALPMPSADPAMFAFFDREASRRLSEQWAARPGVSEGRSTREQVRAVVEVALPEGVPSVEAIAARLELSPRTLQRRLHDEGSSLRKLVDALRHELALRHLAGGVSIAEVSFLLGFSEPSAFHRAFRRWTGSTPRAWRAARLRPEGA